MEASDAILVAVTRRFVLICDCLSIEETEVDRTVRLQELSFSFSSTSSTFELNCMYLVTSNLVAQSSKYLLCVPSELALKADGLPVAKTV
jgi:hypothetical protein